MADGSRRFPPPWRAEPIPGGYVVRDANGQALAYLHSRQAKVLRNDEARRIAVNFARLPGAARESRSRLSASYRSGAASLARNDSAVSRWSDELNADLGGLSPNHPTTADRIRIKLKLKSVRNADRAKHPETRAAVRKISDRTVDRCATICKHDLRSLQHSPAGSLSALLKGGRRG
jgi:hypothetical protein